LFCERPFTGADRSLDRETAAGSFGSFAGGHERPLTGAQFFGSARLHTPWVTGRFRCIAARRRAEVSYSSRLVPAIRTFRANVGGCPDRSFRVRWSEGPLYPET
jgi:hypothetical protein